MRYGIYGNSGMTRSLKDHPFTFQIPRIRDDQYYDITGVPDEREIIASLRIFWRPYDSASNRGSFPKDQYKNAIEVALRCMTKFDLSKVQMVIIDEENDKAPFDLLRMFYTELKKKYPHILFGQWFQSEYGFSKVEGYFDFLVVDRYWDDLNDIIPKLQKYNKKIIVVVAYPNKWSSNKQTSEGNPISEQQIKLCQEQNLDVALFTDEPSKAGFFYDLAVKNLGEYDESDGTGEEYYIMIGQATGGGASLSKGFHYFASGTKVKINAIPDADYEFECWVLNSSSEVYASELEVTVDQNYLVMPKFKYVGTDEGEEGEEVVVMGAIPPFVLLIGLGLLGVYLVGGKIE